MNNLLLVLEILNNPLVKEFLEGICKQLMELDDNGLEKKEEQKTLWKD